MKTKILKILSIVMATIFFTQEVYALAPAHQVLSSAEFIQTVAVMDRTDYLTTFNAEMAQKYGPNWKELKEARKIFTDKILEKLKIKLEKGMPLYLDSDSIKLLKLVGAENIEALKELIKPLRDKLSSSERSDERSEVLKVAEILYEVSYEVNKKELKEIEDEVINVLQFLLNKLYPEFSDAVNFLFKILKTRPELVSQKLMQQIVIRFRDLLLELEDFKASVNAAKIIVGILKIRPETVPPELMQQVFERLDGLVHGQNPEIVFKAANVIIEILKIRPETVPPELMQRVVRRLEELGHDRDPKIVFDAAKVIIEIVKIRPDLLPQSIGILQSLLNSRDLKIVKSTINEVCELLKVRPELMLQFTQKFKSLLGNEDSDIVIATIKAIFEIVKMRPESVPQTIKQKVLKSFHELLDSDSEVVIDTVKAIIEMLKTRSDFVPPEIMQQAVEKLHELLNNEDVELEDVISMVDKLCKMLKTRPDFVPPEIMQQAVEKLHELLNNEDVESKDVISIVDKLCEMLKIRPGFVPPEIMQQAVRRSQMLLEDEYFVFFGAKLIFKIVQIKPELVPPAIMQKAVEKFNFEKIDDITYLYEEGILDVVIEALCEMMKIRSGEFSEQAASKLVRLLREENKDIIFTTVKEMCEEAKLNPLLASQTFKILSPFILRNNHCFIEFAVIFSEFFKDVGFLESEYFKIISDDLLVSIALYLDDKSIADLEVVDRRFNGLLKEGGFWYELYVRKYGQTGMNLRIDWKDVIKIRKSVENELLKSIRNERLVEDRKINTIKMLLKIINRENTRVIEELFNILKDLLIFCPEPGKVKTIIEMLTEIVKIMPTLKPGLGKILKNLAGDKLKFFVVICAGPEVLQDSPELVELFKKQLEMIMFLNDGPGGHNLFPPEFINALRVLPEIVKINPGFLNFLIPILKNLLNNPQGDVVIAAAQALSKMIKGNPDLKLADELVETLKGLLRHGNPKVVIAAVQELCEIVKVNSDPELISEVVETLQNLLTNADFNVVIFAYQKLFEINKGAGLEGQAFARLLPLLRREDSKIVINAVNALCEIVKVRSDLAPQVFGMLRVLLEGKDLKVFSAIVKAICGLEKAKPGLVPPEIIQQAFDRSCALLHVEDSIIINYAADALCEIVKVRPALAPRVFDILQGLLRNENEVIAKAMAMCNLAKLCPLLTSQLFYVLKPFVETPNLYSREFTEVFSEFFKNLKPVAPVADACLVRAKVGAVPGFSVETPNLGVSTLVEQLRAAGIIIQYGESTQTAIANNKWNDAEATQGVISLAPSLSGRDTIYGVSTIVQEMVVRYEFLQLMQKKNNARYKTLSGIPASVFVEEQTIKQFVLGYSSAQINEFLGALEAYADLTDASKREEFARFRRVMEICNNNRAALNGAETDSVVDQLVAASVAGVEGFNDDVAYLVAA